MSGEKLNVGSFCWNELMTPDVNKAKEFYSALLGWSSKESTTSDTQTIILLS